MRIRTRKALLRANAVYLLIAASSGMCADLVGAFLGVGPVATIVSAVPHATIGLVEAHGLAIVVGCLLWRAQPTPEWHLAATAVHSLLGAANLVFWPMFVAADVLAVGYVTTAMHGLFAALQLSAVGSSCAGQLAPTEDEIKAASRTNQTGLTA
jgi:hypothetical protein